VAVAGEVRANRWCRAVRYDSLGLNKIHARAAAFAAAERAPEAVHPDIGVIAKVRSTNFANVYLCAAVLALGGFVRRLSKALVAEGRFGDPQTINMPCRVAH